LESCQASTKVGLGKGGFGSDADRACSSRVAAARVGCDFLESDSFVHPVVLRPFFSSEDAFHLTDNHIDAIMTAEISILRPRDPSQLNSDEWPEFELKQAFVYDPEDPTRAPASLLHAGQYRPLTITGKLEPPNSRNIGSWLDNTARRAVQIDLTDIKEFSYGEYGDGSLDIWAAGRAGWFTIKPSRAYRDTYSDMTQALKLLYFMADSYKAQKKYADLSAPHFFKKVSRLQVPTP